MRTLRFAVVVLALFGVASAEAQTPPRDAGRRAAPPVGTASISGVVTIAGTSQPAARARIGLSGNEGGRGTTTDESGRFAFTGLAAGRYTLSATKPGYLTSSYGQSRPGRPGTPIQLADGQRFTASWQVFKGGVLTGTIVDEHGEVIPGTPVRVLRWVQNSGGRVLQPAGNASTDDRGIYRAYGLQPGDYLVSASPRNTLSDVDRVRQEIDSMRQLLSSGRLEAAQTRELADRVTVLQSQITDDPEQQSSGYAPVYYPGTTTPTQAGAIALAAGEERAGIDFQLQRVPVARVEGTIVNATGQVLSNIQVTLTPSNAGGIGESTGTRADPEGRFRLMNVAPGIYTISAMATVSTPGTPPPVGAAPPPRQEPLRYWAMADVAVDGRNIANLALSLQPGLTMTGRVVFEGAGTQPADLTRVRINLAPADVPGVPRRQGAAASGRVDANGRFTIANIVPGYYRFGGGTDGWSLKSAVADGQDVLDFPLEIKQATTGAVLTFTDRQSELSGSATDQRGQPATTATIVVFPSDQRYWAATSRRIRTARVATDGSFTFTNLPPGEYRVAPVIDPEPGAWFDPAFLQQLESGSMRITIGEGEKKSVQVSTLGG